MMLLGAALPGSNISTDMPLSPPSSAIALYLASRRQQQGGKLPLHQHPFCPLGNSVQYIRNQQTDILPRTHSSKFKLIATILFPRTITISITSSSSAPKPPATATAVTVSTSRRLLISSSASFSAQQLQQQPAAIMGICARWTPKRLYVPVNAGLCHRSGDAAWWRGVATIQQMQARFLAMTYKMMPIAIISADQQLLALLRQNSSLLQVTRASQLHSGYSPTITKQTKAGGGSTNVDGAPATTSTYIFLPSLSHY
ncbi:hypothetical protein CF319_g8577 [Tilletia indica]|nr:hypothetical protein CF319_g8577 [Tilletia indica]